jgi:hypothetical protein
MKVLFYSNSNEWVQQYLQGLQNVPKPRGQAILLQGTTPAPLDNNRQAHNEFSLSPQKHVMFKMSLTILNLQNKTHFV